MLVINKLISGIPELPVSEVIIGFHTVLIRCGFSSGLANILTDKCQQLNIKNTEELERLSLKQLSEYSLSKNGLEASIGIAAINCAYSSCITNYSNINAKMIILEKGRNKKVGIIGHFPFLETHREHYKKCYIFEKNPLSGDLNESDIPKYLPQVDLVAISGTTLANHTFDDIIKHLPKNSFKILLGPTSPLSPAIFDYGIDVISGSIIKDYNLLKLNVQRGIPTRYIQGLEMATIFKKNYQ